MEKYLSVLGLNIIPLFISLLSPLRNSFLSIFIHDKKVLKEHSHDFKFIIVGQSVLICPLASWLVFTNFLFKLNIQIDYYLFITSIYFLFYIFMIVTLLKMDSLRFDTMKRRRKFIYTYLPFILTLLSLVCNIVIIVNSLE